MSAKHGKKSGKPSTSKNQSVAPTTGTFSPGISATATTGAATDEFTPWTESTDPKKRMLGKVIMAGIWVYVAALWLLALDQTFDWGIFGPKVPVR